MTTSSAEGETLFRSHYIIWRFLGILPTLKYRRLYMIYSLYLNITVTIGYPLHLMLGLFTSDTLMEVIKNLAINLTCCLCSIKTLIIWLKFEDIRTIFEILKRQEERLCLDKKELNYYKFITFKQLRRIVMMFFVLYAASWILCEFSVLLNGFMGSWNFMYPGYFPFDPFSSNILYIVAHIYQYYGISFQILQDYVNDSFVTMHLALLSGQIHALSMRLAKLGNDCNKTPKENLLELLKCIQDHKDILL